MSLDASQSGVGGNRPLGAALSMLSAMVVIGFIDNFIAVISEAMGLWQFVVMRSVLMLPLLIIMARIGFGTLRPRRWVPVLGRATALATSMFLYFGALGLMPISQALAGLFTSPIFVLLINVVVQGQRIGPFRILAVACGFVGILLVLQPDTERFSPVMLMPVAAGFFYAISAIATRSWCAGESALALLGANMIMLGGLAGMVLVGLSLGGGSGTEYLTRPWVWPVQDALPWVVLQAVGSLGGVFLIIRAYQMDEPANVAVFEYSVMIFAPAMAWVMFGQTLGLWQGVGIGLIVLAGTVIALRSR